MQIPESIELKSEIENVNHAPIVIQNFVTTRPPVRTSYDIGSWRTALIFAESINGNRVSLYDIYSDVKIDAHLSSQWEKRRMNITNTDWMFTNNLKEVDGMKELLDSPVFEGILNEIMESIAWGITLLELGTIKVSEFGELVDRLTVYSVDRKHIYPKEGLITKEQWGGKTNAIPYRVGLYSNYVAEIGDPDNLGLLLKATPYVLLKKGGVGDWALFVQLFGQPFREYRYDGHDDKTRIQLQMSAEEMGSAPYVILPDGAKIVLHDIKMNPDGQVHSKLVEFCDEQISILVLGNTETTKSSKSSGYAQSKTHMKTQKEVFEADIKKVRRILNRTIKPILYNLGWPVMDGRFHPKDEVDLATRLLRIALISKVKEVGNPVDDDFVYQQTGIPKPANYDELKRMQNLKSKRPATIKNATSQKPKELIKPNINVKELTLKGNSGNQAAEAPALSGDPFFYTSPGELNILTDKSDNVIPETQNEPVIVSEKSDNSISKRIWALARRIPQFVVNMMYPEK